MTNPTTRAEVLEKMQRDYTVFEALLARFNEEQFTAPGAVGDWLLKDTLAHIATWQRRGVERLEAVRLHKEPNTPIIRTPEESAHFTEGHYQANRERSLAEIWEDFRSSYQQLLAGVAALDEQTLLERGRFTWMDGEALWTGPVLYTCEHYAEHTVDIEQWLASQS